MFPKPRLLEPEATWAGGGRATPPAESKRADRSRTAPSATELSRAAGSQLVQLVFATEAARGSGVASAAAASAGPAPVARLPGREGGLQRGESSRATVAVAVAAAR